MKNNQKLTILFWLRKGKTTKDGKAQLYARVTIDGKDDDISLGKKVHPDDWDVEPKQQHTLIGAVNDFIEKFEKQTEKNLRSKDTLRQWLTTRNKIQAFLLFKYKAKDIALYEIKYAFAEDFYDYLTLEVDYPLDDVTAKKHIKKTKQILAGCVTRESIENNPLQQYKCGGENKLVMPLEFDDVMKLYKKEIQNDRLAEVRDAFIFQCFTGFAYQDVYALSPSHITKVGSKGERWLQKDRGKTKVLEMVPLLPVAEEIIARYSNHPYCRIKNCLLPINSNARYNNYLKELAVICDIDRELNTHLAHHTFADMMLNFCKRYGSVRGS
jgi:site-specific recombinase XerD